MAIAKIELEHGHFIFSLDTELAWGRHDRFEWKYYSHDGKRERQAIRRLLAIFDEFNITATWAIVGALFLEHPSEMPAVPDAASFVKTATFEQLCRRNHPIVAGADVVATLLAHAHRHEVAFHGFTHRIFNEQVMSPQDAEFEIREWLQQADAHGITPKTVIFPRNRLGHFDLFQRYGFTCYRGEELMPAICYRSLLGKPARRFYHYLTQFCTPQVYHPTVESSGMVNLPSSRWLFGLNMRFERLLDMAGLPLLRLGKMVKGIRRAAQQRKVIHLWAHPYEFRTEQDFDKLRFLLDEVAQQVNARRMVSAGMAELADQVLARCEQTEGVLAATHPHGGERTAERHKTGAAPLAIFDSHELLEVLEFVQQLKCLLG